MEVHKVLLGTHTSSGEQNYLMVASVTLPSGDAEIDARKYEDEKGAPAQAGHKWNPFLE